jgi:polyhydroxyalkanoate synthesis regulator phasin
MGSRRALGPLIEREPRHPVAGPATPSEVDEQGNGAGPARGPIQTALLAGLGWASLTAEAADDLADELARLVGIERDELRRAVRDVFASWRRDAEKAGLRREEAVDRLIAKLRLVQREEADDLALRLAQLEHRVRLLEAGE